MGGRFLGKINWILSRRVGWLISVCHSSWVRRKPSRISHVDVKFLDIPIVLDRVQGDQDVGLVAWAVEVDRDSRGAAVILQDLAVAPGLVLVGDDAVLQKAHLLAFPEAGAFAAHIQQFQGGLVFQHLVQVAGGITLPESKREMEEARK